MLNDTMSQVQTPPVLPESLRRAVREAEETGRAAEERAQLAMPFRARLRAREAIRPKPTLSILTGAGPVPVGPATPAAISEVRALDRQRPGRTGGKSMLMPVSATAAGAGTVRSGGSHDDDDDDDAPSGLLGRLGDFSQYAFAGLAVLGLAGLSVMAAEGALGKKSADDGEGDPNLTTAGAAPVAGAVSVAALSDASQPAGTAATAWFDYKGTADFLKARIAELEAAEQEALRLARVEADRAAARAIANAEAARAAAATSAGPAVIDNRVRDRLATEEALRQAEADAAQRVAEAEAGRLAKVEADRLAAEEAARAAAAAAEQKRLADAEAARAAEAEARRLADLESKRVAAEAEARRLAQAEADKAAKAAEAKRLADLEAKRAAEAEAVRLASLEAERKAAAEAARLASLATAAAPAPRVWRDPPGRASLKPERPPATMLLAAAGTTSAVSRAAPPTLSAPLPEVRPLAGPRPVGDFIVERAEFTAGRALDPAALDILKSEFLALVEASPDGSHHELATPDGRALLIHFERTVPVDPMNAAIQAIGYVPAADGTVNRAYLQPADVSVRVMCRDVAYAFPGQERGRFAACENADGTWTMARSSVVTGTPV